LFLVAGWLPSCWDDQFNAPMSPHNRQADSGGTPQESTAAFDASMRTAGHIRDTLYLPAADLGCENE